MPWDGEYSVVTYSCPPNCYVTTHYCERMVNGVKEYFITAVDPSTAPPSDCNGKSYEEIINGAYENFFTRFPVRSCSGSGLYPCDFPEQYNNTFVYVKALCWEIVNQNPDPTGTPWYQCRYCPDAKMCKETWHHCCDKLGQVYSYLLSKEVIPGNCDGAIAPPPTTHQLIPK